MNNELLNQVVNFINLEADMLDQGEFRAWLDLWKEEGLYIVPIDQQTNDFANTLNYAYDNAKMREKRVQRLYSGESISTTPRARTIRMTARHRLLSVEGNKIELRCAQSLWEFRKGSRQHYIADVNYQLEKNGDSFLIKQKVIRVINGDDYLKSIGYIL